MSHVTGLMVIDAPASALNNAGKDEEARTDNAVAVKLIRTAEGRRYPYVSAQAVRFWVRTQLARESGWTASPVFRETKVAYTDAEPTLFAEDDLFGYMRAASKSTDEKKKAKRDEITAKSTAVGEEVGEVTRISPFRVGTLVATAPVRVTGDFGTMARAEGDPVPHEHQFYRAHLKAPFGIDLTTAGTFFDSKRVGFKNLDATRIANAQKEGAAKVTVRGFDAYRLPLERRQARVSMLVRAIAMLEGGAKQTLHLTDTNPSVLVLAVCKGGNQPFMRLFTEGDPTAFRGDVLSEALAVFGSELQSDVYLGWARGFLDTERAKLDELLKARGDGAVPRVRVGHPREVAADFAREIADPKNAAWFE